MRAASEAGDHIPTRNSHETYTQKKHHSIDQWREAAWCMAKKRAVLIRNGGVWALIGDAESAAFVEEVNHIKERDPGRTFGLVSSFEDSLGWVDFKRVKDPRVIDLLLDSKKVVDLLGALSFLRVPVDEEKIRAAGVPECLISRDGYGDNPIIQIYDPTGKDDIATLYGLSKEMGQRFMAITSANRSSEPEIHGDDAMGAITFVGNMEPLQPPYDERGASIVPIYDDDTTVWCGDGSYFIVGVATKSTVEPHQPVDSGGFVLIREGNIATIHIAQLLSEYGIAVASPKVIARKPQYRPYYDEALVAEAVSGPAVRHRIIGTLGWQK